MQLTETKLAGAYVVEPQRHCDERGYFARTFCKKEFEERGLISEFVQHSVSFNRQRGTLRGLHFQKPPFEETKLIRCARGAIFDVVVDLRPESPSFTRWQAVELSADNQLALYVPERFAHGFLTLADNSLVEYQISQFYHPESAAGVRWNDPDFRIDWPGDIQLISDHDSSLPYFRDVST